LNLVKAIRKEFMRHSIPVSIRDITGDWDFLVDAWGVASPEQLNEITDHIRRENRDILETSTSIVFDEYR
ncbi:MAG: Lrp/AsnC ligand binding domain-containing protein, partial [Candidatus Bathyarchaeia archaeon]